MPQDAYTLRHIARELNAALSGGKVNKIIQPSRDEVDILLYAGGKTQKLLLNTHATFARAVLSRQARTAPEVAPNFCMLLRKHLTGAQLTSVTQLGFERILAFAFDCTGEFARAERVLYAEIMGKYSNLVLTENGVILGALKVSSLQENFKRVLFPGVKYAPPAAQDKADPTDRAALAARLSAFSGGDLARFLSANVAGLAYSTCALFAPKLPQDAPAEELADSLRALIFSDETAPAVERVNGEPTDFHARLEGGERYASVLEAADSYYTEREEKRGFADAKRRLESALHARLKKEEKKLALLEERRRGCADMEKSRLFGELLTANLYAVPRGAESCTLQNWYEEGSPAVTVPLDRQLTPSQNAQKYYKKYNKLKRTLAAVEPQIAEAEEERAYTLSMLFEVRGAEEGADLVETEEELRAAGVLPAPQKKKNAPARQGPFRAFETAGFRIFAGRNNLQNDRLLREASPPDMWLHAQRYHSAHVLVRTEGKKLPDAVLQTAAEICAYYSDAQSEERVPVDVCERRFVKKPPKARAGFVVYTDFTTVAAKPDAHPELAVRE